jgi:hypothetical protein
MGPFKEFYKALTPELRRTCLRLNTPDKIQEYLDNINYCNDEDYHSPLTLMKTKNGCCLEGALFAAALLRRMGHPPLILELTSERDDDHIIAVYRKNGLWGAVAKSNYVGLRARQPVYRTLRELVLTYFELYYNVKRERSLRGYSVPLSLARFDSLSWMIRDDQLNRIAESLDYIRHFALFPRRITKSFPPMDGWMYRAGMMETDVSKTYHPSKISR